MIRTRHGREIFLTPNRVAFGLATDFLRSPTPKNLITTTTSSLSSPKNLMEAGARGNVEKGTGPPAGDGGGPDPGGRRESIAAAASAAAGPSSERQVIRWERFLPRRSLRVLLVEHDDSTRHIVAALLRKCSYHVAAVADGLKAWEVLKEKRYNFDLVLTEVEMPSLSGIGLLSKIMAAEECKNIPVIMMSNQDSIGVVLKCMLKGAVDFLVKPVRKNELRNLWQHVWRRHCSSSGTNASDNNAASNHISVDAGVGSKTGENSDEGDAQSSGSKPEMQSKYVKNHMESLPAVEESTSKKSDPKEEPNYGTDIVANQLKSYNGNETRDKISEPTVQVNQSVHEASLLEQREDKNVAYDGFICEKGVNERDQDGNDVDPKPYHRFDATNKSFQNMIEFIEPVATKKCVSVAMERVDFREDVQCEASASSHAKSASKFDSSNLLELSLRRPQLTGCVNIEFKKNHLLNHSNASAFSRYGDKKMQHSSQRQVSSVLSLNSKEPVDKTNLYGSKDSYFDERSHSASSRKVLSDRGKTIEIASYLQVSSDRNKECSGILSSHPIQDNACGVHSSDGADSVYHAPQFGFVSLPVPVGAIPYQSLSARYGTILQPLFYQETSLHLKDSTATENEMVQHQYSHHDNLVNHSRQFDYHSHEENYQSSYSRRHRTENEPGDSGEPSCTPLELVNQSGSSALDIYKECGINGCSKTTEADANALESWNESGAQNSGRKCLDCDHSRREAALIKFRLKRKDRCFEKKVRYHSRKKLAEQRPRIKGQFVCQKTIDSTNATEAEE
ncbi:two-component response regulator-like PRR95 isoform X1 [Canna indica]|uniref:Two-component response regulator-like PRR95 isoform X1 n=1 Tax=Canna indica TaxID=4628 RepID=A0AAQ3K8G3_9LILI|nr:two-component response regulator-like PRR95 isoform X1 [Canna indica]